jgi:hypothetical protein
MSRDAGVRSHIYLSDVSGEVFQRVLAAPSTAGDIAALRLADRVQILLDGASLLIPGKRDSVAYDAAILARSIALKGGLKADAKIDFVVSKLDLIAGTPEAIGRATASLRQAAEAVAESVRGLELMVCARTADREKAKSLEGMDGLVSAWTGARNAVLSSPNADASPS